MSTSKNFTPLLPPQDKRPRSLFFGPAGLKNMLRDSFTLTTWLAIGGAFQSLLFLTLPTRLALLPPFLLLAYRILTAYAMSLGLIHNTYMDGVIRNKFSAQFPDEAGEQGNKPSSQDVVVLLIGMRYNHPLGFLSPGGKDMTMFFPRMAEDLETHADEFGFLGMTSWTNSNARADKNEVLEVAYFRTVEGLNAFAQSKYHMDAWKWWNENTKRYPHLSIYHEVYHAPAGHWENIYVNSSVGHFASTQHKYVDRDTGKDMWASPIVEAKRGPLRSALGRMARSQKDGAEHAGFGLANAYN